MHGSAANPNHDIIDTAINEASFARFLSAIKSVHGMVDHLKGAGPFTVFLPTDQAFEALAPGTIQLLSKPENHEKLERLLKTHIVKGLLPSGELRTMLAVHTESGDTLPVRSSGSDLTVNGAALVGRDIACTNGMIHAVDALAVRV